MLEEKLRGIHALVGQLVTDINEIELGWYFIYGAFVFPAPKPITDAIFNFQNIGNRQRQLVMTVAGALYPDDHPVIEFLGKLKSETDLLIGRRNAVVHSGIFIQQSAPPKITAAGIGKPSKLKDKDIESELRDCIKVADRLVHVIFNFLNTMEFQVGRLEHELPRPPKLRDEWINPLSQSPEGGAPQSPKRGGK
ncbi:MAG: hypothetical protein KF826_13295 [Xanthobacteraceae bacterium]|nr:hypothetical protein [Xanthobacteraceae bacterium]MBX3548376.1 hypothetical protein [Xanthobacteraceae bacterium]MCW5674112.1 hypothetical protein [Xanthobacteraceae bacterium]MCW5678077.1 hypothetical protein [Xanthobacteraceae bacterium]